MEGKDGAERLKIGTFREIIIITVHLLIRDGYKSTDIISVFQETFNLSISCLFKRLCDVEEFFFSLRQRGYCINGSSCLYASKRHIVDI